MNNKEKAEDSILRKFGRLTVVGIGRDEKSRAIAVCECECGVKRWVMLSNLKRGKVKSCGCLLKESRAIEKRKMGAMLERAKDGKNRRKSYLRYDEYDDFGEPNVNFGWKI